MRTASLFVLLLTLTACTQEAAVVEYKGQETFGRDKFVQLAALNYSDLAPGAGVPQSMAPTTSIGVADLAAPAKPAPVVAVVPPAPKETPKVVAAAAPSNPWTRKARTPEPVVAAAKKPAPVATAPKPVLSLAKPVKAVSTPDFIWPVESKKVVSTFGPKGSGVANDGINIASRTGERVWAAADGEVVYAGNKLKGYGNMVIIKHNGGKSTTYAYMNRISVNKYARVKQGDTIGYVGNTGGTKSPQLHFAMRDGNDAIDPLKHLKRTLASAQ